MNYLIELFDAIKGNNGTWVQWIVINIILNIRIWVGVPVLIYYLKKIIKEGKNSGLRTSIMVFLLIQLIGHEIGVEIVDRKFETKKYKIEYVKKTTDNLVIVVQGANSPFKDFIEKNKTQVDIIKSRDENGLGFIKSNKFKNNTQVLTYVGSHSENLTTEDVFTNIYYYKLLNPDGKIILVGHSIGGDNVLQVVDRLSKQNIFVEMVILLDPANKKNNNIDYILPKNVQYLINFTSPKWTDNFKFFTNSGGKPLRVDKNHITIEIPNTIHTSIDNEIYPILYKLIKNYVENNQNPINLVRKYKF